MVFSPNAGFAIATNTEEVKLLFTVTAANTEFTLDTSQSSVLATTWMIIGNGSTTLSAARAAQIVANATKGTASTYIPQTNRIAYTNGVSTDIDSETASGLQTYFTNIPAVADGARCIAFAVGGNNAFSCIRARAEFIKTSATGGDILSSVLSSNGVGLGVRIKDQAGNMLVTYAGNPLAVCNGVIFGNFVLPDGDSATFGAPPAVGDKCVLTLTFN